MQKKLSNLPFSHFPRGNSVANQPHRTSQQLNHHHSTNHATHSKLTLPHRRPPAIHSFPPPSRRPQQIQPFPQSGTGKCLMIPHSMASDLLSSSDITLYILAFKTIYGMKSFPHYRSLVSTTTNDNYRHPHHVRLNLPQWHQSYQGQDEVLCSTFDSNNSFWPSTLLQEYPTTFAHTSLHVHP